MLPEWQRNKWLSIWNYNQELWHVMRKHTVPLKWLLNVCYCLVERCQQLEDVIVLKDGLLVTVIFGHHLERNLPVETFWLCISISNWSMSFIERICYWENNSNDAIKKGAVNLDNRPLLFVRSKFKIWIVIRVNHPVDFKIWKRLFLTVCDFNSRVLPNFLYLSFDLFKVS